jgi:hypothetical protein
MTGDRTMKRIAAVILVLSIGGFGAYWLAGHHVVRAESGYLILEKRFLSVDDTYVDVRSWTSADYDRHPQLKRALIIQGYDDLLADLRRSEIQDSIEEMVKHAEIAADEISAMIETELERWLRQFDTAADQYNEDTPSSLSAKPKSKDR